MHSVAFDGSDPRASEPLVDIRAIGIAGENYYARTDGNNPPYNAPVTGSIIGLYVREGVANQLLRVNEALAAIGVELFVWDAYRPVACQEGLWDFFFRRERAKHPGLGPQDIAFRVRRFVSDPTRFKATDPTTWPAHCTGGSVDLTLREKESGRILLMGTSFDEMSPESATAYFEQPLFLSGDPQFMQIVRHRRLLYWVMKQAGFTNYGTEYWHYDIGNQLHILSRLQRGNRTKLSAWYGYVPPPEEASAAG